MTKVMNISFADPGSFVNKFSEQYQNHAQADSFLHQLIIKISRLQLTIDKYEKEKKKDLSTKKKKTLELAEVNDRISFLKKSINFTKSEKTRLKYTQDLLEDEEIKRKLELWMMKNNPNKDNEEFIINQVNRANLEYTQAVAQALCEWFATGAIGPGTLAFNGKTYRVE